MIIVIAWGAFVCLMGLIAFFLILILVQLITEAVEETRFSHQVKKMHRSMGIHDDD